MYASNDPNSRWTSRNAFAFDTALSTLSRLRTMPASASSFSIFASVVSRDACGIEIVEHAPVMLALVENGGPAQARLRAFQHNELEERAIVMERHAPFRVVVGDVGLALRPSATLGHFVNERRAPVVNKVSFFLRPCRGSLR